ncbi:MAG: hypothetical protein Q9200_005010 [Gallowayella weberi]
MPRLCYLLSSQLPVPSPDGILIAFIASSQLHIRCVATTNDLQIYDLPPGFDTSCRFIRWYRSLGKDAVPLRSEGSKIDNECSSQYLLLADDARIIVYHVKSSQLYAEISGATTLTKLADVDFGQTPDQVMVCSDFGYKLQVWSLKSKRAVEIKDFKHGGACYSYRSNTGHLALLARPAAHDILLILAPHSHEVLSTSELSTVDARGIKYSPDGNWLAVWDTASAGCRVIVLTANGHHFKTYARSEDELSLGIKCLQWSPSGHHLAIGDQEGSVTLLGKNTVGRVSILSVALWPVGNIIEPIFTLSQFTPHMHFFHPSSVQIRNGIVWQEELGHSRSRSYAQATQPAGLPSQGAFKAKARQTGIALMEFNASGDLLASTSSDTPSTVWIHSLQSSRPLTSLIHHSPMKALYWHPVLPDLLLMHCAIPEPTVHLWRASWHNPKILSLPLQAPIGKLQVAWLSCGNDKVRFLLSSNDQSAIGQISYEGEEVPWHPEGDSFARMGPEAMFDEGHSIDLSPVKLQANGLPANTPTVGLTTELDQATEVQDTFHYRHPKQTAA